ncbi:MAG: DUF58 domain-containing protein [Balneola sp.]|nr:MAG: DUF58 domain-containing protein [Balneola sp.]
MKAFLRSLYLSNRFFQLAALNAVLFVVGYFYTTFAAIAEVLLLVFGVLLLIDFLLLYRINGIQARRTLPQRFSNGDENPVSISITNNYAFSALVKLIDEIPSQFQQRDFNFSFLMKSGEELVKKYELRPTERGEYHFGSILVFAASQIGLLRRKYAFEEPAMIPVYPSFIQMRKFEMYAISNRLTDIGIKKIRRIGHTMEFDQIKEYVQGDDVRSINWKATARSQSLMVNQFQDERSQQVINVIDMGRVMKMPFDGLHLLDYAINTSLVLANISLIKDDKAGLVTFSHNSSTVVKPERRRVHIQRIQDALYNLETNFLESDFERLIISLRRHINQRSLVMLYTNFETVSSMKRQLPYLQRIAKDHLLVVVFFQNTELEAFIKDDPENVGEVYTKIVAEKFNYEKKEIVKALNRSGIQTILTPPKELSVNAINKYLELKARGLI